MPSGWFNLETAGGAIPETQFFEGDSAFKFLGLSRTTRLYGFIGCLAVGFLLSILGSIVLFVGQLGLFAVLYVLGTIVSLIGTGFLIGFLKQLKLMFKPVRVVASIVFLASIGLVFVGAFVLKNEVHPSKRTNERRLLTFFLTPSDFMLNFCLYRIPGLYLVYTVVHPLRACRSHEGRRVGLRVRLRQYNALAVTTKETNIIPRSSRYNSEGLKFI
ncbi:ER-to-Golgi vesicle protein transport Sft2 [Laccaria bicolor S238N-H82]|uniref:Protein transport protein SFT2 n=1 Tax=Laccaria bicolor (strain S238N-H82 / ATCC MYA-4686) TaxID=486041 RepID=B0D3U7_LACBS|nr:ER-to-Golgi vesicle protein transport Sft2 [Laccaria bicolor S238N-H82]EDR11329.1 ER-to-Golgi vesicle protein transport Sft2 [Laccaria bicolor S238N-H82]|eukprot:XP_001878630.1 ER-to-Golgi vesicle protein transport Sft2 [Laccaria bicolor S238N-H82]